MRVMSSLFLFILSIALACEKKEEVKGESGGEPEVPSGALVVSGGLENGEDADNSDILKDQDVFIKRSDGNILGTATTDENGEFEVNIAAGALQADQSYSLGDSSEQTSAGGNFTYALESTVEDDGDGKALGIRKNIELTTAALTKKKGEGGTIDLGTNTLTEIGAITGTVEFDDDKVSVEKTDVFIPGKSFFVRTSDDGKFHMLFVPAGTYTVRIENGLYFKEEEVTVEVGKTTKLGTVTVTSSDRDPLPLSDVIIGTWTTKCWSSSGDPDVPTTGTLVINSLTDATITGDACIESESNLVHYIQRIYVLNERSILVYFVNSMGSGLVKTLFTVQDYSNNDMIIPISNGVGYFKRAN